MVCPESGYRCAVAEPGILGCLDLEEEAPRPKEPAVNAKSHHDLKAGAAVGGAVRS